MGGIKGLFESKKGDPVFPSQAWPARGGSKFLKYLFFLPPLFLPFSLPPSLSPSPLFPRARGAIVREIQRF